MGIANKGRVVYGPNIVRDGLIMHMDAANPKSFFGYGLTAWDNLVGTSSHATLSAIGGTFSNFQQSNKGIIMFHGDSYVTMPSLDFSNYSSFTISFWVKVTSFTASKYFFSKLTNGLSDNQFSIVYSYVHQNYELYAGASGSGANQAIRTGSQIAVTDTNWHHLCYAVGATTTGYLDGVLKFTNNYGYLNFTPSSAPSYICSFNGSSNIGFHKVSNFALYNRSLSPIEISRNYNALLNRFTGFAPENIAGLSWWVSADSIVGISDGQKLNLWKDLSGNNNHAIPNGLGSPVYKKNIKNGLPAVEFTSSDAMRASPPSVGYGAWTAFVVARPLNSGAGRIVGAIHPSAANWLLGWWNIYEDRAFYEGWVSSPNTTKTTNWKQYTGGGDGISTGFLRSSGILVNSNTGGYISPNGGIALNGYSISGTAECNDCQICEVILYNAKLSDTDMTSVEQYLIKKWNV